MPLPFWLAVVLLFGTQVIQALLRPKPKVENLQPTAAGEYKVVTSEEGRAIPALWGKVLQKGMNLVWWGDYSTEEVTVQVVKPSWHNASVNQTIGYKYRIGAHYVLGHGPIDSVDEVWFDDRPLPGGVVVDDSNDGLVWSIDDSESSEFDGVGHIAHGSYASVADFCRAVQSVVGYTFHTVFGYVIQSGWCEHLTYWVYSGGTYRTESAAVPPNKYSGASLATALAAALNLTESAHAAADRMTFTVTYASGRFTIGTVGGSNVTRWWIPPMSPNYRDPNDGLMDMLGLNPFYGVDSNRLTSPMDVHNGIYVSMFATNANRFYMTFPAGMLYWKLGNPSFTASVLLGLSYSFIDPAREMFGCLYDADVPWATSGCLIYDRGEYVECVINYPELFGGDKQNGGVEGTIIVYKGTMTQPVDGYLLTEEKTPLPAYLGICYAVARSFWMGNSPYIPSLALVVSRYPNPLSLASAAVSSDANPANLLYELFTDPTWGLGISPALLDAASFAACGATLATEGLGLSMVVDRNGAASGLAEEICRYIDGILYVDPATGALSLRLARADYDPDDLPTFDESNLIDVKIARPAWADTRNTVRVRFTDRADFYQERVASAQDSVSVLAQNGAVAGEEVPMLGITSALSAAKAASRILMALSYPFATLELKTNRSAWNVRPGDLFKLTWPRLGITDMVCRVSGGSFGTLESGEISISAVEDVFAVDWTAYAPVTPSEWITPSLPAAALADRRLEEAWYAIDGSADRYVVAMCVRGGTPVSGFEVWSDAGLGGNLVRTNIVSTTTPYGTLQAALAIDETTSLTLENCVDCDRVVSGVWGDHLLLVDDELIAWTTITTNEDGSVTLSNLARGSCDTAPRAHDSATPAWLVTDGFGLTDADPYPDELEPLAAYLTPFNASGTVLYIQGPRLEITTDSRASRPSCPTALKMNDEVYPASITAPVIVSWEHRNRLATSSYEDSSMTAAIEPGCQYLIKAYDSGGLLLETRVTTDKTFRLDHEDDITEVRVYTEVVATSLISHDYLLWEGEVLPNPTPDELIDGYSETNGNTLSYLGAATKGDGQSFAVGVADVVLSSCKLYLHRENTLTGLAAVKVYAHQGTWGTNGKPTGAALAVSDGVNPNSVGLGPSLIKFYFSGANRITLAAGTHYVVAIEFSGGPGLLTYVDTSAASHPGNRCYSADQVNWNTQSAYDLCFNIYSEAT